jgi:endoglucanase
MDERHRAFLDDLLSTATPSGFETAGQRTWLDYVAGFAGETRTDAYGNAVATVGDGDLDVVLAGHGDEIGMMVRDVTDDGFLELTGVGGSDRTVTRGQHVVVHGREGPVPGVVGQVAIHLREDDDVSEINEMHVDVGAADEDEARELVEVGDPITFDTRIDDLAGTRVAARGMDNRAGIWAVAESLRRAADRGVDATIHAVSTVQEEVGKNGARMVGFDLAPDVVVATDVTHATDTPEAPGNKRSGVDLGEGPVVGRGSTNHPLVVDAVRDVAADEDPPVQLAAAGTSTGTDADAFSTSRAGVPTLNLSIPNRYMHTPVEVIDTRDLDAVADLMGAFAARATEFEPYAVDL